MDPLISFYSMNCNLVLVALIRDLLATDHPEHRLAQLADTLAQQFALVPSEKHMIGRDLGRLAPTPSLKYKAAA